MPTAFERFSPRGGKNERLKKGSKPLIHLVDKAFPPLAFALHLREVLPVGENQGPPKGWDRLKPLFLHTFCLYCFTKGLRLKPCTPFLSPLFGSVSKANLLERRKVVGQRLGAFFGAFGDRPLGEAVRKRLPSSAFEDKGSSVVPKGKVFKKA